MVGDEAGKCYFSLMLCWAHGKLNDPVVSQWIWLIGAINFRIGGQPFVFSDWQPLLKPRQTGVSVNSTKTHCTSCLLTQTMDLTQSSSIQDWVNLKTLCILCFPVIFVKSFVFLAFLSNSTDQKLNFPCPHWTDILIIIYHINSDRLLKTLFKEAEKSFNFNSGNASFICCKIFQCRIFYYRKQIVF